MGKLILRDSCYDGLKNVKKSKSQGNPNHEKYMKEADKQIKKI